MAKKAKTRGITHEVVDTGIYVRKTTAVPTVVANREFMREWFEAYTAALEKHQDPLFLLNHARTVAQKYVDMVIAVRSGKAVWDESLGDMAECHQDAFEMMARTGEALAHIERGDTFNAIAAAYWAGRLMEKLRYARPAESVAKTGKCCIAGARIGGSSRRIPIEEIESRASSFKHALDELLRKNPHITRTAAIERLARARSVSESTVRRALRPTKKQT